MQNSLYRTITRVAVALPLCACERDKKGNTPGEECRTLAKGRGNKMKQESQTFQKYLL